MLQAVARARSGSILELSIRPYSIYIYISACISICMAAVCQSVQIEMYVCNLSKDFSLSMILVMSDTLYIVYDNFEAIKEVSCMCYPSVPRTVLRAVNQDTNLVSWFYTQFASRKFAVITVTM